jgi:hypothetical protein
MNSKLGRDVSLDKKNVYGAKRCAILVCGKDDKECSVGRLAASPGFDAEGLRENSSS